MALVESSTAINRRVGREKELRQRMKDTLSRYEAVFGKVITVKELREWLIEEGKEEKRQFLRDRMGFLSNVDTSFLLRVIDDAGGAPEMPPEVLDEMDEIEDKD